jgi:hypothetical protein
VAAIALLPSKYQEKEVKMPIGDTEKSVDEADRTLRAVQVFEPQTGAGLWEKEKLLPRVESASVIAHQRQMNEDGQREVRALHRMAGC